LQEASEFTNISSEVAEAELKDKEALEISAKSGAR
jgi:hypothetical protein